MRNFKKIYLLLGAILLIGSFAYAQKILALNKPGKEKRIRYLVKQKISVKLYGEKYLISGTITDIRDSSIDIDGFRVPINQIRLIVDFEKHRWASAPSAFFFIAGTAFLGLDITNRATQGLEPIVNSTSAIIGSGLVATGAIFYFMRVKRYRINRRHWLQIIDWGNEYN